VSGQRCVMAYSGGLDTSAMLPWLRERGYEVHAVLVNVGQDEDLPALCDKALRYGAASAVVRDARPTMFERALPMAIALASTYEGTYRLGTALARPFIALEQVRLARELGGATLVHGATGKGNDQIRFEFAYRSLAPDYPILAPWKSWEFGGRVDLVNYLAKCGYQDNYAVQKDFSLDENLWHLSVEGGPLEDPASPVEVENVLENVRGRFAWSEGRRPASEQVEIEFQHGTPIAVNGLRAPLMDLLDLLNRDYRNAGWGWDMVIENRFTGIKSRGLYINPGVKLLHLAADALARTCLNKPTYDQYVRLGCEYGTMIYRGEYFSDQRLVLESAAAPILKLMSGRVTVRTTPVLYASRIENAQSLFTKSMATFEATQSFDHGDAGGFIRLSWLSNIGRPFPEELAPDGQRRGSSAPPRREARPERAAPVPR
jgi:argininosuccinate synthase